MIREKITFTYPVGDIGSGLLNNNVNPLIIQSLFGHMVMTITPIYNVADSLLFDAENSLDAIILRPTEISKDSQGFIN